MARLKLHLEKLSVQAFSTGGTAVADRPARANVEAESGDFSCFLDHTGRCDTDGDCSGHCFVATNVCSPC
jgi:hypothetical protein